MVAVPVEIRIVEDAKNHRETLKSSAKKISLSKTYKKKKKKKNLIFHNLMIIIKPETTLCRCLREK